MTTFFTADLHLGHKNVIKFCNRPFADEDEMDSVLIKNWNSAVDPDDEVYHVGDFTLSNTGKAADYLSELNGNIWIIQGSHDRWMANRAGRSFYSKQHRVQFLPPIVSLDYLLKKEDRPIPIVLCHYSMRSWDRSHYGSWHLFGHHHGELPPHGLSFDIGVDTKNFFPYSLSDVAEKMSTLSPVVDYSKKHE